MDWQKTGILAIDRETRCKLRHFRLQHQSHVGERFHATTDVQPSRQESTKVLIMALFDGLITTNYS